MKPIETGRAGSDRSLPRDPEHRSAKTSHPAPARPGWGAVHQLVVAATTQERAWAQIAPQTSRLAGGPTPVGIKPACRGRRFLAPLGRFLRQAS